jgi:methylglutamate dehydrogenase subunit C
MVRQAVGVCRCLDAGQDRHSGQGRGRFLDFVYTNTFSTLPVGRVRYGLMLREDGLVLDDGTTARLGEEPLPDDHHHGGGGAGDAASGFRASGLLRGLGRAVHLGHRAWAQFAVAGRRRGRC